MERRKKKKLARPPSSSLSPSSPSTASSIALSSWKYMIIIGALLLFPCYLFYTPYSTSSPPTATSSSSSTSSSPAASSSSSSPDKISYDEYVRLAKREKWTPEDPLEKLLSIAFSYNNHFDLASSPSSSPSQTSSSVSPKRMMQMAEEETKFVLRVLMNSKEPHTRREATKKMKNTKKKGNVEIDNDVIDLTPVLFEAIEGVHRGIVRAGKQLLQNHSSPFTVTRQFAESSSMSYQYGFVFALLRLVRQVSSGSNERDSIAFPHLLIDLERKIGRYSMGALGSAVSLNLYRLYEPLVLLGANCSEGMAAAVRNGDDLSTSMLLHLCTNSQDDPSKKISATELQTAHAYAEALGFYSVSKRLLKALSDIPGAINIPHANDFMQVIEELAIEDNTKDISVESYGYMKTTIIPESKNVVTPSNECAVDIISASNIEISDISETYFQQGRPVVFRGLLGSAISSGGWSFDSIRNLDNSVKVTPKLIPYSDQLSKKSLETFSEAKIPLSSFCNVMRDYSLKVDSFAGKESSDLPLRLNKFGGLNNTKTFLELVDLPQYVFDNKILSSDIPLEKILEHPFGKEFGVITEETPNATVDEGASILSKLIAAASTATYGTDEEMDHRNSQAFTRQFFMGPPMSGAPFHYHGPAFNALVYGRKLWNILPPGRDLYSNVPPLVWSAALESRAVNESATVENENFYPYEGKYPCHIEQLAGDVMFVPSLWSHQILNLEETIGFATELHRTYNT